MSAKKVKRINYNFTIEVDLSDPEVAAAFREAAGEVETFREAAAFFQMDAAQTAAGYIEDTANAPVRIIQSQGFPWS